MGRLPTSSLNWDLNSQRGGPLRGGYQRKYHL